MVECDDGSVAVYNKSQDSVYVRPAAQELYEDMYQQTQAMKALMNQAELLTRKDWKKGSQSVTVGGADFEKVLEAIRAETQGANFPKPEEITKNFKNFKLAPLNDAMERTFRQQQDRLQRFAKVNNSFTMNPGQIQSYFERFVQGLERLDDLSQRNSAASDNEANKMVGDFINDLVVTGQGGPFSAERRAAAKAVLDSFAPNGLIPRPQNQVLNTFLSRMNLKTSLDDSDLSRREYAAELRDTINKISGMAIRGGAELLKKTLVALGWAGNADVAFAGLTEGDEVKGIRLLDRLNAFFDYGQPKKPAMPGVSMEESVIFHLGQLANNFENSEIVKAVKELANEAGLLDDPYYRLHAVLAINQALKSATQGRFGDFSVHIENAYAALDCYRGYGTGLALSVWSTAEGAYKVVSHPLNSTYAIAISMVNYEDTWKGVKAIVREKYDTLKNCDQDTFACGQVAGQLAGDIFQTVVGLAELKGALTASAAAKGTETAAQIIIDSASDIAVGASKLGIDDAAKLENLLDKAIAVVPCDMTICGVHAELGAASKVIAGAEKWGLQTADDINDYVTQLGKYSGTLDPSSIPYFKGAGPQAGVIALNDLSKSNKALKNYIVPNIEGKGGAIEFVYDVKTNTFATGLAQGFTGRSPHQSLAASIHANEADVVGGMLKRKPEGGFFTNEESGHFFENWNVHTRNKFADAMENFGIEVSHSGAMTF
jgi:hypothetical protein